MKTNSAFLPPKSVSLSIFITQFFFSFSFFGFYFILILFLKHNISLPSKSAYILFGNFVALNYIAEFFGGLFGGRYINFRVAAIIGLFMSSFGFLFLAYFHDVNNLNVGLTLIACGTGLFLPNLRNLLGILYQSSPSGDRDNAFTILHVFNIVGQILGPTVLSLLGLISSSWIFVGAGISLLMGGFSMLLNYHYLAIDSFDLTKKNPAATYYKAIFCIIALIFFIYYILCNRDVKYALSIGLIILAIVLIVIVSRMKESSRTRVKTIFILYMGLIVADICFRQIFGAMNLFTDTYIDRQMGHLIIPTAMLQSMEPVFLLMIAPLVLLMRKKLEDKKIYITPGTSASMGLFMLGISFCVLAFSTTLLSPKIPIIWLFLSFIIMACAELFLLPIIMSALSELSPTHWRGLMMGIFALSTSIASYLSGFLGEVISPISGETSLSTYGAVFLDLGLFAASSSVILFFVWKYWQQKHPNDLSDL